jgi:large subunit ribosomal protein L29
MGANKALQQKDIVQYSTEDLAAKINEDTTALRRLTFNHAVTTLDNPLSIRAKRRDIARLLTELNKR